MNDWTWAVVLFVGGFVTGIFWREAFELFRRKEALMDLGLLLKIHRTTMLMWALIVSMMLCSAVGVGVIVNNNGRDQLVHCLTMYNRQSGEARDERNAAADTAAAAEIAYIRADLIYQQGLLRALRDQRPLSPLVNVITTRLATNRHYLATLTAQQRTRAAADYPPPDLCEGP